MKQHLISGTIAAVISAAIAGGTAYYVPKQVEWVEYTSAAKHAWPALTDEEKTAFTAIAKGFPKDVKFDIVCNDAGCSDLAADIDDAFEDAGIESALDKAIGPLGYGIGVQVNEFDRPAAEAAIAAVDRATDGRLKPTIVTGDSPPHYVTILIGKRPR